MQIQNPFPDLAGLAVVQITCLIYLVRQIYFETIPTQALSSKKEVVFWL